MMLAHVYSENNVTREQTLKEHTLNTAKYAEENLSAIGLSNVGRLCGLLHDMGKATCEFANYLEKSVRGEAVRGSVVHSTAGMAWLYERYYNAQSGNGQTNGTTAQSVNGQANGTTAQSGNGQANGTTAQSDNTQDEITQIDRNKLCEVAAYVRCTPRFI